MLIFSLRMHALKTQLKFKLLQCIFEIFYKVYFFVSKTFIIINFGYSWILFKVLKKEQLFRSSVSLWSVVMFLRWVLSNRDLSVDQNKCANSNSASVRVCLRDCSHGERLIETIFTQLKMNRGEWGKLLGCAADAFEEVGVESA